MISKKVRLPAEGFISLDSLKTVMTEDGETFLVSYQTTIPKPCGDSVEDFIDDIRMYSKGLIKPSLTLDEPINEDESSELRLNGYRPATEREMVFIREAFK